MGDVNNFISLDKRKEVCSSNNLIYVPHTLVILHEDWVTGIRDGAREYGFQIEVRCWDSEDAVTGSPTRLPYEILEKLASRITSEVPGVVSVTYNISSKPPTTIEAV